MIIEQDFIEKIKDSTLEGANDIIESIEILCNSVDKLYYQIKGVVNKELDNKNFEGLMCHIEQLKYISKEEKDLREYIEKIKKEFYREVEILESIVYADEEDKQVVNKCKELLNLGILKEEEVLYLEGLDGKIETTKIDNRGLVRIEERSGSYTLNQWVCITLSRPVSVEETFNRVNVRRDGKGVSIETLI